MYKVELKTVLEVLKLSSEYLQKHQIPHSRRVAEEILAHTLQFKRMDIYLKFDQPLLKEELISIREALKRCALKEPLQYILGELDFLGCSIRVDKRALIPRPETEVWVEKVSKEIKEGILWDLCTGSGCIGIALKKKNPHLQVTLSDISIKALSLAKENAQKNQVDVTFVEGDLFAPFAGKKADFIVCNPPYISKKEYENLDVSVKHFEPSLALIGGEDGLDFYRRLKQTLSLHLKEGGVLFLEIGASQEEAIQKIFPGCKVERDWASLPRFVRVPRDLS